MDIVCTMYIIGAVIAVPFVLHVLYRIWKDERFYEDLEAEFDETESNDDNWNLVGAIGISMLGGILWPIIILVLIGFWVCNWFFKNRPDLMGCLGEDKKENKDE